MSTADKVERDLRKALLSVGAPFAYTVVLFRGEYGGWWWEYLDDNQPRRLSPTTTTWPKLEAWTDGYMAGLKARR